MLKNIYHYGDICNGHLNTITSFTFKKDKMSYFHTFLTSQVAGFKQSRGETHSPFIKIQKDLTRYLWCVMEECWGRK